MKRILTGLVLTPFFFYIVVGAPDVVFLITLAAVATLCLYEFLGIASAHLANPEIDLRRSPLAYLAGIFLLVLPSQEGLFLVLLTLLAWIVSLRSRDLAQILPLAAFLIFGVIYTFGSWRCGLALHAINPWWMLFATASNWVGDTFAFYAGKNFGRHKMAPVISPGKSWEGAVASLVSVIVLGMVFLHWKFPQVGVMQALLLCTAANVIGQVGDLCESAIKRGAGVKDSGTLLPGHGGWLDRVDSSLFSIPMVYWLLQQKWILP